MSEHRPGYVYSTNGFTRIAKGQVWYGGEGANLLVLSVVGIEEGAVYLWPEDPVRFRELFSRKATNKQGEMVDDLAFKEMGSDFKKGSSDEWKNGTFAAHEAWDVWKRIAPSAPTSHPERAASGQDSEAPGV